MASRDERSDTDATRAEARSSKDPKPAAKRCVQRAMNVWYEEATAARQRGEALEKTGDSEAFEASVKASEPRQVYLACFGAWAEALLSINTKSRTVKAMREGILEALRENRPFAREARRQWHSYGLFKLPPELDDEATGEDVLSHKGRYFGGILHALDNDAFVIPSTQMAKFTGRGSSREFSLGRGLPRLVIFEKPIPADRILGAHRASFQSVSWVAGQLAESVPQSPASVQLTGVITGRYDSDTIMAALVTSSERETGEPMASMPVPIDPMDPITAAFGLVVHRTLLSIAGGRKDGEAGREEVGPPTVDFIPITGANIDRGL